MDEARAYTYVDRSRATVGNRWFERSWSAFLGNTNSLFHQRAEMEWIASRCAEFEVVCDDASWDVMDFGEVSWSEENSRLGATLVARQERPGFEVTVSTLAYHDNPGMRRSISLRNTSRERIIVRRVAVEQLPVWCEGLRVLSHGFEREHETLEWDTEERGPALTLDGYGLFVGVEGGARFSVFTREPNVCSIFVDGPRSLDPSAVWQMPPAFILPFSGDIGDASRSTLAELLMRLREKTPRQPDPPGGG